MLAVIGVAAGVVAPPHPTRNTMTTRKAALCTLLILYGNLVWAIHAFDY
jgi:hypothetical protein